MKQKKNVQNHETKEENKELVESAELLSRLLVNFTKQVQHATSRRERYENLMQRKSVKKWSPKKTAKAVRRLLTAGKEQEQATSTVEQIKHRLEQLAGSPPQPA